MIVRLPCASPEYTPDNLQSGRSSIPPVRCKGQKKFPGAASAAEFRGNGASHGLLVSVGRGCRQHYAGVVDTFGAAHYIQS